jgi:hypothetical protein
MHYCSLNLSKTKTAADLIVPSIWQFVLSVPAAKLQERRQKESHITDERGPPHANVEGRGRHHAQGREPLHAGTLGGREALRGGD